MRHLLSVHTDRGRAYYRRDLLLLSSVEEGIKMYTVYGWDAFFSR